MKKKIQAVKDLIINKGNEILSRFVAQKKTLVKKKQKSKLELLFQKVFSTLNITATIGIIISLLGIIYFSFTVKNYLDAKHIEKTAIDNRIKLNQKKATKKLVEILNAQIIYPKNIRKILKILNKKDENGRIHVFSPCDEITPAFGEHPEPGNIIIKKTNVITIKVIAHDCNAKPFEEKIIRLAPIRKAKPDKNQEAKTSTKDIKKEKDNKSSSSNTKHH